MGNKNIDDHALIDIVDLLEELGIWFLCISMGKSDVYLDPSWTSAMESFCENSHKSFNWILNTFLQILLQS